METNRHMQEVIVQRQPVTARPDATVQDACREMREQRVGTVLVTDAQGHLLGIFTDRDAVCRIAAESRDAARTTLAEVMTARPDTIRGRSQGLGAKLGQSLVIENRPGGNGVVATMGLLASPPDGHAVLLATADTHTVLPAANPRLLYNVAEFVPVTGVASVVFALVTRPGLPVTSVSQLVELAKNTPQPLTYASYGVASASHAAGEMFCLASGTTMVHVPYQGAGPAVLAITADQVDVMMVPVAVAHPQRARLNMLAVASGERFSLVPDVPTMAEAGLPLVADAWIGLLAAPGTPPATAEALNAAVQEVVNTPEFAAVLRANRFTKLAYGPTRFAEFLRQESARWGQVVREAHITIEG